MTVKQEGDYSTMTEDEYESARDSEFFMWRDKLEDIQHMMYQNIRILKLKYSEKMQARDGNKLI